MVAATNPDPLILLREVTPEQIVNRLAQLDGEAKALRVLLRSARARQRAETQESTVANLPEVSSNV